MAKKTKKNVASGNDVVALQIGTVRGQSKNAKKDPEPTAPAENTKIKNVRSGDAHVGAQVDEIHGGLFFGGRW